MRTVKYTTYWSYNGPGIPRENTLAEFLLDIPYFLMNSNGVIPNFEKLNDVLRGGGNKGGMGPGTTWRPFQIKPEEYVELIDALLAINPEEARQDHPYISFEKIFVNEELNNSEKRTEWLRQVTAAAEHSVTDDQQPTD